MECNKSEAIRAKEIAEKRMQNKDFAGAHKLALKAQKLYPGLENLSQMLTVCEVHVSAELNVVGSEADWYGILQVPQTVDELTIKKQYRKLALILHPDKNKFPGAEAAFKLIGEANRVLFDQAKRSLYDIKRRTLQTGTTKQLNNFAGNIRQQHQQRTEMPLTFWTSCPFCSTRYQQYTKLLNRVIRCQKCLNPFVAYDLNAQGVNSGYAWNQSAASQHNDVPNQGAHRTGQGSTAGNSYSGFQCQEKASNTEVGGMSRRKASEDGDVASRRAMFGEAQSRKSPRNVGRKRGRNAAAESGESFSGERPDVKDAEQLEKKEMESPPIKKKNKQSSKDADNLDLNSNVASNSNTQDPITYPEPEFHDFDKDRVVQENFQVAQIWAVYDDTDGMPRWYAQIRKIYSNGSRLRILWLEADPKDKDGQNWLEEGLPVACGNFRTGKTQDTEDLLMFSHLASWERGNSKSTYKIYPRKGEVWALLKDWSIQWSTSPNAHRKYEFEFVEILCDYAEGIGVEVTCLVMLDGFTSLFQRMENMENNPCQIQPSDILRFSHRVPCYRMTGEERQGVPAGSFELDPASVFTEASSPAKGVDKVFDKGVDVESSMECCKPGTDNKIPAAGPEILSTAKESSNQNEKILHNGENVEKGSCLSEAKEKESATVWPEKSNGIKKSSLNGKDIQSNENLMSAKFRTEKETPVTGPDVLNAPNKSTSSNEEMLNMENLVNRRCSPRKIVRSHQKPCQGDAGQHPVEEGTCFNGGADSLDDMPENKTNDTMSIRIQIDEREKESVAGKVPQNGATEENCPPDPVFCGSAFEKLEDKFHRGQIWALYSSVDGGLPKYYAWISKVESPKFKVHANWLEACPESEKEIWWSTKELPITCGTFMLQTGESVTYEDASIFSHRMRHTSSKGKKYLIIPRKGEVWAIYKNWSSEWTHEDLEHCEYELVEVLSDPHSAMEVMVLEVVDGYRTVYRGSTKMDLPRDELLRFSHLVPSFRLTKEGGGKLKGCLELDPLALPDSFFTKTSK